MLEFDNTESLNGLWQFAFCPNAEPDEKTVLNVSAGEYKIVPGCFDTQSLFGKHGTGIYRRTFTGKEWLQLRFEGLGLRGRVWVDDIFLGSLDAPFTPYEFLFNAGPEEHEMTLTVAVSNVIDESDGSLFHEFYDFYSFGGIYRSVSVRHLASSDGNGISNIKVTPLDASTGHFRVQVDFLKPVQTTLQLLLDDTLLANLNTTGTSAVWEGYVKGLSPWSPESPILHTISVKIPTDQATTKFGSRTLTWNNGEIKLNGKPLKLYGLCRHDSHPDFGYAMSETLVLNDLYLIKESGCNFIRGSHYTQSDFFLDCCDRLGLLVWEESCGWGNSKEQCGNDVFRAAQQEQTQRMVERHYNHPSIILWGVLNECDSTSNAAREILQQLFDLLHRLDHSRPSVFASNRHEADIALDLCDVIAFNAYPGWYDDPVIADGSPNVKRRLKELETFLNTPAYADKPWIISEIGAAALTGDHSGFRWSEEYQEKILTEVLDFLEASSRCSGMSWWLFANANTYLGASNILLRPRGFNNKGLLSEYRKPKLAWHTLCRRLNSYNK